MPLFVLEYYNIIVDGHAVVCLIVIPIQPGSQSPAGKERAPGICCLCICLLLSHVMLSVLDHSPDILHVAFKLL